MPKILSLALTLLIFHLWNAPAPAAEPQATRLPSAFAPRFEVTVSWGGADQPGFEDSVLASMHRGNLDRPEVISTYREYPIVDHGASSAAVTIDWRVHPWASVALEGAVHAFGEVRGHSSSSHDHFVDVRGSSRSIGALLRVGRIVHIGAGPVLEFVDIKTHRSSVGATEPTLEDHVREQKPGFVLDVSARFPERSRAYFAATWQRLWSGSVEIGPYDLAAYQDDALLPRTTIELDRTLLRFGFGVRF